MFTFLKSIFYGFISGFAEILPISFPAHKSVMLKLFGMQESIPFCDLLIHIAVFAALIINCKGYINLLNQDKRVSSRTRGHTYKSAARFDRQLIKTAAIPMLLGMLLSFLVKEFDGKLLFVALFLLINGAILLAQEYIPHGNKTAIHFSSLDCLIMGIVSALHVFPGLSRTGLLISYSTVRGADRQAAIKWILLLSIPAMLLLCVFDLITIITAGFGITSFLVFLYCIVSAVFAYIGASLAIRLIRALTVNGGYAIFAYYSLGAALFSVVLFLIS